MFEPVRLSQCVCVSVSVSVSLSVSVSVCRCVCACACVCVKCGRVGVVACVCDGGDRHDSDGREVDDREGGEAPRQA